MALKISTKGRYALRVMIDLAEHDRGEYIPLKEIAERQDISEKYLEGIIVILSKAGVLDGQRGKGGGYKLAMLPEETRVGDILRLIEGSLAPVVCLKDGAPPCPRVRECRTVEMWTGFYELINSYFDGITLADLIRTEGKESISGLTSV